MHIVTATPNRARRAGPQICPQADIPVAEREAKKPKSTYDAYPALSSDKRIVEVARAVLESLGTAPQERSLGLLALRGGAPRSGGLVQRPSGGECLSTLFSPAYHVQGLSHSIHFRRDMSSTAPFTACWEHTRISLRIFVEHNRLTMEWSKPVVSGSHRALQRLVTPDILSGLLGLSASQRRRVGRRPRPNGDAWNATGQYPYSTAVRLWSAAMRMERRGQIVEWW
ncbi:hypothetical protein BJX99DRAFT_264443 [Aspergillus californicus]